MEQLQVLCFSDLSIFSGEQTKDAGKKLKVRRYELQIPKICDAVPGRAVLMGSIVNISRFKFYIIKSEIKKVGRAFQLGALLYCQVE